MAKGVIPDMTKRFLLAPLVALIAGLALIPASSAKADHWSYGPSWSSFKDWKTRSTEQEPGQAQDQMPSWQERVAANRPNYLFQGYGVGLEGNTMSLEVDSVYNRSGLDGMSSLLEGDTIPVRLARGTTLEDSDGNVVTKADLAQADEVDVIGRVGPRRRWMRNSDGVQVPTVLAKKVIVQSWTDDWADAPSS